MKEPDKLNSPKTTYSVEVEQELLGAILKDNSLLEKVSEFLRPEHFYLPINQLIYSYIVKFIFEGLIASPATLKYMLEAETIFQESNGENYLQELITNVVTTINVSYHGKEIFNLSRRRALIKELGERAVQAQNEISEPIDNIIHSLEATLDHISDKGIVNSQPEKISIISHKTVENIKEIINQDRVNGISSGFIGIDANLGGLHNSDLIILAGRPGMGKSAIATNIATKAANKIRLAHNKDREKHKNNHIVIFSLEMSGEELAMRILCENAGFSPSKIRKGYNVGNKELEQIKEANEFISELPIIIDDSPYMSISQIRQRTRKIKNNYGLAMIIIDYLQLLNADRKSNNSDNRVYEISEISRGLKNLAKEMNVPVIALSQLNRKSEDRENPIPKLSDLRDSGSIEQDADIVMFIYREEYYLKKGIKRRENESDKAFKSREEKREKRLAEVENNAELIVSKNRHGALTTIPLYFEDALTRFSDKDEQKNEYENIR